MASVWTWSDTHQNYYTVEYDANGQARYLWAEVQRPQPQLQAPSSGASTHGRNDSAQAIFPPPVDSETRNQLSNFIGGTPQEGWYHRLDSSYRVRTGAEAYEFFKKGRVFAMLHTEAAGQTARHRRNDDSFSEVRYGEQAFSQIRRFVIVSVRSNFVLACAIFTYGDQGTLKPGCHPSEHAVAYNSGTSPRYFPGEREAGLVKEPIEVQPSNETNVTLKPASRIRFGKVFSIEWNVKVKDIGRVVPHHMSLLGAHYAAEEARWN